MKKERLLKYICITIIIVLLFARSYYSKWEDSQNITKSSKVETITKDEDTVFWNVGRIWERDQSFNTYFNELLKKYGCSHKVEFRVSNIQDEAYGDMGMFEPYAKDFFKDTDIITLTDNSIYARYYDYYGQQGNFLKLDDLFESNAGKKLYEAYPEIVWESLKIGGNIFGIGSDWMNRTCYLIVNQSYLEKHGINDYPDNLINWMDLIEQISEKEQKGRNKSFLGLLAAVHTRLSSSYIYNAECSIRIVEENGCFVAESAFDNDDYMFFLKRLNQIYKKGYMHYSYSEIERGNFLASFQYSYSEQSAIHQFCEDYSCPKDVSLIAIAVPELKQLYDGNGIKTVISASSDRSEKAFQILSLCMTEPELSNALVYGREGIEYTLENGKVVFLEDYSDLFTRNLGNPFLIYSLQTEPIDRGERLLKYYEDIEVSPLMGFRFDILPVKEEWSNVIALSGYEYIMLWSGISNDFEEDIKKAKEKLNAAGLQKVLDELNRQLAIWQEESGEADEND